MVVPVIVVTPTPGFGALIQQTLEESGRYQVALTQQAREALALVRSTPFSLCILDLSEENEVDQRASRPAGVFPKRVGDLRAESRQELTLLELGILLHEQFPALRMVVIPPRNDPEDPLLATLPVDGLLTKPFYLPDLLDTLEEVMPTRPVKSDGFRALPSAKAPAAQGEPPMAPVWLEDVNRAARHLARLSLEAAAQAALIVRDGELWAYAGELPQPASQELSRTIAHHWSRGGSSDLARFIRLEATQSEYMLYATRLGSEMVLALVFDVETPFSKIRSQANRLARALSSPPSAEENGLQNGLDHIRSPVEGARGPGERSESPPPGLPPLFDDVPPPSPLGWESIQVIPRPQDHGPGPLNTGFEEDLSGIRAGNDPLADTRPSQVLPLSPETQAEQPTVAPAETADFDQFEPVSAAVCNLNYTCMLIPRFPNCPLAGELANRLPDWISQLSLAFDWRLGQLTIHPDYLLWIVSVSPTVSPSFLVRLMRQHTSQRIFTHFPEMAEENPSGDFWAPGYLVMTGSQPPPAQVVQDFIRATRRRQGTE